MATVAIAGAGFAGLGTALLLARRGHDVTVVERDDDRPPGDAGDAWRHWRRPGVPQLRQFHGYTALGRNILRRELPDVHAALLAEGATGADMLAELRRVEPSLQPHPDDDEMVMLRTRRTTYELVLRRAVDAEPPVTWHTADVTGVVHRDGRVTGLTTDAGDIAADLVVDCTGRRARSAGWLHDGRMTTATVERSPAGIVYYNRWYRVRDGDSSRASVRQELDSLRAVLTPADDGFMSLALMAAAGDPALRHLRDVDTYQRLVERIPGVSRWVDADVATAESDVMFMGGLDNARWQPRVAGLVTLGDAAFCTNPYFGRGVSLAFAQAVTLTETLDELDDPAKVAAAQRERTAAAIGPWYDDAVVHDRVRSTWLKELRGERLSDRERVALTTDDARVLRAIPTLLSIDSHCLFTFMRYIQSLGHPRDMTHDPRVRERALSLDALPPPALSRDEIVRALQ